MIEDLIMRLQAMTGPDPVIDVGLQWSVLEGYRHLGNGHYENPHTLKSKQFKPGCAPKFTRDLGVALTLLPPGMCWVVCEGRYPPPKPVFEAQIRKFNAPGYSVPVGLGEHATNPAIAFCIAALDARMQIAAMKQVAA